MTRPTRGRLARLAIAVALLAGLALLASDPALARVGGGQGYSGGSESSRGGAGGEGDGALFYLLFRLLFWLIVKHPLIGIPLAILIVVVLVRSRGALSAGLDRTSVVVRPATQAASAPRRRADLSGLIADDPSFSLPLFEDFAQLVYARALAAAASGRPDTLAPWASAEAAAALVARGAGAQEIRDVIFGATSVAARRREGYFDILSVSFETNFTEVRGGAEAPILARESWAFRRRVGVRSPGPERMRALGCVGCGSTLEPKTDGSCPNCGSPRKGGLLQWEVVRIERADLAPLAPLDFHLGGGIEPGTGRPTSFAPDLPAVRREFETRHPDHSWPAFEARVRDTFERLQKAWSSGHWEHGRPFETDSLFQVHRFWMERYRKLGMHNRIEQVVIREVVHCEIGLDAYYEWITVRIFASALDWTEDAQGRVVAGSRDEARSFSEYWTFLRAAGAKRLVAGDASACPACGAPVDKVNMAGICEYCGSKLTTGAFDWVVSKIEQD